ncbi:glycosyltransferase, partial [Vibrio sinaloensis]|uniref:glycosyltransferase family 2 protein n=1 Tax=Photobacterium sp. (strain ATCC 43367) TaxID=379097 RepID=UPI002F3E7970
EEKQIGNTLSAYKSFMDRIQVIVIPNGCIDRTEEISKAVDDRIEVLTLTEGSKVNAINYAYKFAKFDHILVQDADTLIEQKSIQNVLSFINKESYLFASLVPETNTSKSGWIVRSYYSSLSKTPEHSIGMVGSGCYLLSRKAASKCFPFPQVIADDGYVKSILDKSNLSVIPESNIHVQAPRDVISLIKIKTRSKLGNIELSNRGKKINGDKNGLLTLFMLGVKERAFIRFLIYASITAISLGRARWYLNNNSSLEWERDNSTR